MLLFIQNKIWIIVVVLLGLVCDIQAAQNARVFPGGASGDNFASLTTVTPQNQTCTFLRLNVTTLDATTRRPYDWSDGTHNVSAVITSNAGNITYINGQFATTSGNFSVVITITTGVEHTMLWCFDASNVANIPVMYYDGVAQTVGTAVVPVGATTNIAQIVTIGNRQDLIRSFPGTISAFAIWGGTMLDATSATDLNNGKPPCRVSPDKLLMYYFIEGINNEPEWTGNSGSVIGTTIGAGSTVSYDRHCGTMGTMGVGR